MFIYNTKNLEETLNKLLQDPPSYLTHEDKVNLEVILQRLKTGICTESDIVDLLLKLVNLIALASDS